MYKNDKLIGTLVGLSIAFLGADYLVLRKEVTRNRARINMMADVIAKN